MGYESKIMVVENYQPNNELGYRHIVAEINMSKTAEEILNCFDIDTNGKFYISDSGWQIAVPNCEVDEFYEPIIREDRYGDSFSKCSDPFNLLKVLSTGLDRYEWYKNDPKVNCLKGMIMAFAEGFESGYYELIHYGY